MIHLLLNIWGDRLDGLLCYFSPQSLICLAKTNHNFLTIVKNHFSRVQKNYTKDLIWKDESPGKWHLHKDVIRNCLLILESKDRIGIPERMVMRPVSQRYEKEHLNIYGWIVDDTNKMTLLYGRWAYWIQLKQDCENSILKIIPWREKTVLALEDASH